MDIANKKRVLILSPHTDDAELGAGGLIAKLLEEGHRLHWIVYSSARESVPHNLPDTTLHDEFIRVMNFLDINEEAYHIYDYAVRRLNDNRQEILEGLIKARNKIKPDLVIGPSFNDYHQDHQIVANEMIRAFKNNCSILCYELPWNHMKFENQFFATLSDNNIERKLEILSLYKSQISLDKMYFDPAYIKGLARTRGIQINAKYAEAFEVIKWIL